MSHNQDKLRRIVELYKTALKRYEETLESLSMFYDTNTARVCMRRQKRFRALTDLKDKMHAERIAALSEVIIK